MSQPAQGQEQVEWEDSRLRSQEGVRYGDIVREKLQQAMALGRDSIYRVQAAMDLDILLLPKRDKKYEEERAKLRKVVFADGKLEIDEYEPYADGLLEITLTLMNRCGLLGGVDIEDEPF